MKSSTDYIVSFFQYDYVDRQNQKGRWKIFLHEIERLKSIIWKILKGKLYALRPLKLQTWENFSSKHKVLRRLTLQKYFSNEVSSAEISKTTSKTLSAKFWKLKSVEKLRKISIANFVTLNLLK